MSGMSSQVWGVEKWNPDPVFPFKSIFPYFWEVGLDQEWQIFGTHTVLYFPPHPGQTLLVDHGIVTKFDLGSSASFPRQQLLAGNQDDYVQAEAILKADSKTD